MSLTRRQQLAEDIVAFEERAAIREFDGGLTRLEADTAAARELGGAPSWRGDIVKVIDTLKEGT